MIMYLSYIADKAQKIETEHMHVDQGACHELGSLE